MKLEKHRIYCETSAQYEYIWLEEGQTQTLCPVDSSHMMTMGTDTITEVAEDNAVTLTENKNTDGNQLVAVKKSYSESSKSFTSPDFSNRQSWYFDSTLVSDEVMTTADNTTYASTRVTNAGWDHDWINWKSIPNNARQELNNTYKVVVKKNEVVITTGFTIGHKLGQVIFTSALTGSDVIKVSYMYANSSTFDLVPLAGKKLLVDYIETQFSVGCVLPENAYIVFQPIYNGPAIAPYGIPANTDVPLKSFEYHSAKDFLNESTAAYVCKPFMELTKEVNVLPWNYLSGHTMKPPGDVTTDITKNEFNKLRMQLVVDGEDDPILTSCEIATGAIYCYVETL